jgi:dihydrofolate reductase
VREVVYYVATSADGFIARADGSFDGFPWDEDFGAELLATFPETLPAHLRGADAAPARNRRFDTVLMGRRTYEVGLGEGITNPYPTLRSFVFSTTLQASPDPGVALASSVAEELVRTLRSGPGLAIWLCGGSELAGSLFAAGLVDRLIVKQNPVLFGSGIPLLARGLDPVHLRVENLRPFESGHLLLEYVRMPPKPSGSATFSHLGASS